jgi:hypothetical protein
MGANGAEEQPHAAIFARQAGGQRRGASNYVFMLHSSTMILSFILPNAPFPIYIGHTWGANKNRASGILLLACKAVLIASIMAHAVGIANGSGRSALPTRLDGPNFIVQSPII